MTTVDADFGSEIPELDRLFIAGAWTRPDTGACIDVVNPATEEVVVRVAAPSASDADRAVAAAREAFDRGPWPRMTVPERVATCSRMADRLEANREAIARAWTIESGAPVRFSDMMLDVAAGIWRHVFNLAPHLSFEEVRTSEGSEVLIRREPVGTVLAILTYNGPINLLGMKVFPALIAGCPVVIKSAPESQLTMRLVAESAREAGFPDGVLSVLAGDAEVSKHLVGHPGIDMVAMTGGTEVAMDVVRRSAAHLARTALELGGKSPAIITQSANLEEALPSLVPGATAYSGQVCVALSRILAPRSRYEEVVATLAKAWQAIRVGDPLDTETEVGPLATRRALARTERFVASAVAEGARIVVGGERPAEYERGWYYQPTLLRDVANSMEVAQQEVFGPVTCVIEYEDHDDAIRIANDTKFGLADSVYSDDPEEAVDIARQIRAGSVAINTAGVSMTEPFGGMKQSGWGRECGPEGVFEFTQLKQIVLSSSLGFDPAAV